MNEVVDNKLAAISLFLVLNSKPTADQLLGWVLTVYVVTKKAV